MAKRLTDTDIWKNQRWFRKLDPLHKLAFCYIKDQCNHAGIWKIDCSDLMEDTGIANFSLPNFIKSVNTEFDKFSGQEIKKERIRIVNNTFLWITGFIQFQQENKEGKVNAEANPVKTALEILSGFGVLEDAVIKGFLTLTKGKLRVSKASLTLSKGYINSNSNSSIKPLNNNTLKRNKKPEKKIWNTMPKKEDIPEELPEQYITSCTELVFRINNKFVVERDTILGLWEVFKTQNLTGSNFYPNEGKVYSHFLNVIRNTKFLHDGTGKGNNTGGGKLSPSQGRQQANRDY